MTRKNKNIPHVHFLDDPQLPDNVTRFWLIRHAVVEENARKTMYGALDVALCEKAILKQKNGYMSLAQRLPKKGTWYSSPLKRAIRTAEEIQKEGDFLNKKEIKIDSRFIEQSIGDWHGTPHDQFTALLKRSPHPFWSLSASEKPPRGESILDVYARVGHALEDLADENERQDTIIVSHGGAIRAALAHALSIHPENALRFTIQNLSLSIIERINGAWRVIAVNELPKFN
ncbi:histidine phosphatase family protein [Swingsia samuiensis]|uniref:Histidine phosphatase family protein n=1 Tax=Swingsia samuiensis TaxID=1293412 RepID=A0A4Y6UHC3_9PROT|nr:histidine phosphatase family protein [Swingsia samuiensis]QDH16902.1 histidine phosphatase family protein [Swingsia samuiensis]